MEPAPSIRDRIFAAADALYTETDRRSIPTVDAVRKRAHVNMNDASTGMKEWRRARTATANPVPAQLPPELQASCTTALAALWSDATALANESLRAAQARWEAERQEADELSRQMAAAYDRQSAELEAAQGEVNRLDASGKIMRDAMGSMQSGLEAAETAKAMAENRANQADFKTAQVERRADELRKELDHAHEQVSALLRDISAMRDAHARQMEHAHSESKRELDKERGRLEHEQERSHLASSQALAEVAMLRGKLEVLETWLAKRSGTRKKKTSDGVATTM